MRDDDEGATGIGGQSFEKVLKRIYSASRGSNSYDREGSYSFGHSTPWDSADARQTPDFISKAWKRSKLQQTYSPMSSEFRVRNPECSPINI
jgi:hypothetical protein